MPADPAPASNPSPFREQWLADLKASAAPATRWLWTGYLAAGSVTLLTSPWKAGKTTLIAALLHSLKAAGLLAGRDVRPGKAVVVSEESAEQWLLRSEKFDFADHVCFLCRPFRAQPRPEDWLAMLDHLLHLRRSLAIDLLVIDPLAAFLPGRGESDAGTMLSALLPLQRLTTAGMAVLLLHHPRKQASAEGQWARGSGALSGYVDILLEMHYYSTAASDDRRRKLLAYSRFAETPRRQVLELDKTGTDWRSLGDIEEEEFTQGWKLLHRVLEEAREKLTRAELLAAWPEEHEPPAATTLWRWLDRALGLKLVQREGTGRKNDPHRYWLPGQEEKWRTDPELAQKMEIEKLLRELGGEETGQE